MYSSDPCGIVLDFASVSAAGSATRSFTVGMPRWLRCSETNPNLLPSSLRMIAGFLSVTLARAIKSLDACRLPYNIQEIAVSSPPQTEFSTALPGTNQPHL